MNKYNVHNFLLNANSLLIKRCKDSIIFSECGSKIKNILV